MEDILICSMITFCVFMPVAAWAFARENNDHDRKPKPWIDK